MFTKIRLTILLLLSGVLMASAAGEPSAAMPKKHLKLFASYCLDCHDNDTEKGSVNLETLPFELNSLPAAELWQKVLNAMNSGEMPPIKKAQPTAAEKTAFLADLSKQLVVARKILSDTGGVITMRRLNRREYRNSISSLLGVKVGTADLPSDSNSSGFDTSGASLFFSSDQFEQYLKLGRQALDEAIVTASRPTPIRHQVEAEVQGNQFVEFRLRRLKKAWDRAQRWRKSDQSPTEFGFIDAGRVKFEEGLYRDQSPGYEHYLSLPETKTGMLLCKFQGGTVLNVTELPAKAPAGRYLVKARVGAYGGAKNPFLEFGTIGEGVAQGEMDVLGCRKLTGTVSRPEILEFSIEVTQSGSRKVALRERQPNIRNAARSDYRDARRAGKPLPDPLIWIDWVSIKGPIIDEWPPKAHRQIFLAEGKQDEAHARKLITWFAQRAFRIKPPTETFVDRLLEQYRLRRELGDSFAEAMKEPLAIVLASPSFLYQLEPTPPKEDRRLKDSELAVRLAYFLTSSPPDADLLALVRKGKLGKPWQLRQQTDRLLDNSRSWEFVSGFTHQWLHMDRLDFFQFNYRHFGEFDDSVKLAARNEVYHTIDTILRNKLGIGELLDSDFAVINDLLADYYGIDGVEGPEFRKVALATDSKRGGLLGMAAIHAMGSDGERTSPVERGAWILRKLLHDPPPPAPPNVPQLSRLSGKVLSAREMQDAHMEEPQCAQCHRKIDPLGYGLENFDAVGQWRENELIEITDSRRRPVKSKTLPIDPSGTLPDGTPFKNFTQMRNRIAKHEADFARGFTEALIEYGLGRPFGFSDHDLADQILAQAESKQNQMREFIHALVQSKQFQSK